jgi:hypothetical protein
VDRAGDLIYTFKMFPSLLPSIKKVSTESLSMANTFLFFQ